MCKRDGETIDHLLWHCPVAKGMWNMEFSLYEIYWVMHRGVVELLASWLGKFNKYKIAVIWRMISHCLMWGIWQERNAHTFKGNERPTHELMLPFFQTVFEWMNASGVIL